MTRKLSSVIAAAIIGALLSVGALANDTFPLSVNETGPVYPQHATVPAYVGASSQTAPARDIRSHSGTSQSYEVQTPSSVNESAPWLTGTNRR